MCAPAASQPRLCVGRILVPAAEQQGVSALRRHAPLLLPCRSSPSPGALTRTWCTRKTPSGPRPPSAAASCKTPAPGARSQGTSRPPAMEPAIAVPHGSSQHQLLAPPPLLLRRRLQVRHLSSTQHCSPAAAAPLLARASPPFAAAPPSPAAPACTAAGSPVRGPCRAAAGSISACITCRPHQCRATS